MIRRRDSLFSTGVSFSCRHQRILLIRRRQWRRKRIQIILEYTRACACECTLFLYDMMMGHMWPVGSLFGRVISIRVTHYLLKRYAILFDVEKRNKSTSSPFDIVKNNLRLSSVVFLLVLSLHNL